MRNRLFLLIIVLCAWRYSALAQGRLSKSDLVKIDFAILAKNKQKIQAGDAALAPAYKQLVGDANALLDYRPVSVMQKKDLPPSGDRHDYMSIAPYWWPDPAKKNGLPYIRKDGEVNPEVNNYTDKENLPRLCENVYTLALAYYFSGQEKYAVHAARLVQVWFLDTATRMNPNLSYGQAVKGVIEGRAEGLIDTRHFIFLLDGIALLQRSTGWSPQKQEGLKNWFSAFLAWMQTSKIGTDEMNAKNNHGVWYDAQELSIALFVDSTDLAKKIIGRTAARLDAQMDSNGMFPLEMERTTSLHYTVFLLNAFYIAAGLAEKTGTDFWNMETPSGKSLQKAFVTIRPFITQQEIWKGKQINPFNFEDAFPLLLRSAGRFGCTECIGSIERMAGEKYRRLLINLL